MDHLTYMQESEQQLINILGQMRTEDAGWTADELEEILHLTTHRRKQIVKYAIEQGYMIAYLGYRKYRNGVINKKTLYMLTDKSYANSAQST